MKKRIILLILLIFILTSVFFVGSYFLQKSIKTNVSLTNNLEQKNYVEKVVSLSDNYFRYRNNIYYMDANYGKVDIEFASQPGNIDSYYYSVVAGADFDSFEAINHLYGKDKFHVFWGANIFEEADVNTFEIIDNNFSRDKNRVYYNTTSEECSFCDNDLVSKMNPKYFQKLGDFIKDDKLIYIKASSANKEGCFYQEPKISDIDAATFSLVKDGVYTDEIYYKDKHYIYVGERKSCLNKLDIDTKSFEKINSCYFKDSRNVYFVSRGQSANYFLNSEADISYFSFDSAKQNTHPLTDCNYILVGEDLFYRGEKINAKVELNSLEAITIYDRPDEYYIKDKNHVFYKGEIVKEANPEKMTWLDSGPYFISGDNVFLGTCKLIDAQTTSMKSLVGDYVSDNNNVYSGCIKLDGIKDVDNYDFSYLNVGDTKLSYTKKEAGTRKYILNFDKNGKTKKLYSDVVGDCCGGGAPLFEFTKNPNIVLLESGTGDACFGLNQKIYIDIKKESILSVEFGFDCQYENLSFNASEDSYVFNFAIVNEDNKIFDYNTEICQLDKKYYLSGFSFSKNVYLNYDKKINIDCIVSRDTGQNILALPEISYDGVSSDLSGAYFSINTDWCVPNHYKLDFINKKIWPTGKAVNLLKLEYEKNY